MEVDLYTPPPQGLGPAFDPTPSSPAVALPLDKINLWMNAMNWSGYMNRAGDDPKKQAEVFGRMLIHLTNEANSEENFIESPSRSTAEKLIESLDEKGLKEWQDGAKAGIDTRDWARLALHRTFWIVPYLEIWRDSSLHSDT
jgi:hypothetical protein